MYSKHTMFLEIKKLVRLTNDVLHFLLNKVFKIYYANIGVTL